MTAPASPLVRVGNIPAELKALDHWIVFQTVPGKRGKLEKLPYVPGTWRRAKSNDPSTWGPFGLARADAARTGRCLGFCFTPELPYLFLDFDDVLGAGGAVKGYAATVIDALDSYSEISAGGAGVHVIVKGALPERFTKAGVAGPVEIYPQAGGRFCLLTGDTRPGLGSLDGIIEERTAALAAFFPARPRPESKPRQNGTHVAELTPDESATIVEILRPHRTPGQQHHLDLAIGGLLAKSGVPESQALAIIDELSGSERKARSAIQDSYKRFAAGLEVRGYDGLRELLAGDTPEVLAAVDVAIKSVKTASEPKLVTPGRTIRLAPSSGNDAGETIDRWPSPPTEVYHGWFGGYLELVRETTEAPDQFLFAAALTIIGAHAGRNVYTRHASGRIHPNLFTVLVGLSSESKKDTAMARACDMVIDPPFVRERTSPPYAERFGVASAESFIGFLAKNPNILIRMSEFSEILANARRKGTTTILSMLMKAWDTPPQLSNDSIQNPAVAFNPYVSLLAGTQPDVLAADMIGTDITSGFANRVLFVPGSGKEKKSRPPEVDEKALHAHWLQARKNLMTFGIGQHIAVDWSDKRNVELWDRFYLTPRGELTIERTMSQRHQNQALKIALIFALTDGATAIAYEHLRKAIAFLDWEWSCLKQLIRTWATSNDNRLEERIVKVLQSTGPIKRRALWHKCKDPKWSANDFGRMLRSLTEIGTLASDDDGNIGLRED